MHLLRRRIPAAAGRHVTARRLVLFDIDGTLLLTAGAGRRAIRAALLRHLPEESPFDRVRFDGKTDPQIVAELLAEAGDTNPAEPGRLAAVCDEYLLLLEAELAAGTATTRVLPGVESLLSALEEEAGVVLGLLTGNLEQGARLKLRAAGLRPERFRLGAYGSDSAHRPELPAVAAERAIPFFSRAPSGAEVVIIGDTPADVQCGLGLGARGIGVATGFYPREELLLAGAHAAFEDLTDLEPILEAILQ